MCEPGFHCCCSREVCPVPTAAAAALLSQVCDLLGRGMADLVLGRDDGSLEVYALDCAIPGAADGGKGAAAAGREPPALPRAPRLVLTVALHESVQAVACGHVSSAAFAEVIVLTYRWGRRDLGSTPLPLLSSPLILSYPLIFPAAAASCPTRRSSSATATRRTPRAAARP